MKMKNLCSIEKVKKMPLVTVNYLTFQFLFLLSSKLFNQEENQEENELNTKIPSLTFASIIDQNLEFLEY